MGSVNVFKGIESIVVEFRPPMIRTAGRGVLDRANFSTTDAE